MTPPKVPPLAFLEEALRPRRRSRTIAVPWSHLSHSLGRGTPDERAKALELLLAGLSQSRWKNPAEGISCIQDLGGAPALVEAVVLVSKEADLPPKAELRNKRSIAKSETTRETLRSLVASLVLTGVPAVHSILAGLGKHPGWRARDLLRGAVKEILANAPVDYLVDALLVPELRAEASALLIQSNQKLAIVPLSKLLRKLEPLDALEGDLAVSLVELLVNYPVPGRFEYLTLALKNPQTRSYASRALSKLADPAAIPLLVDLLREEVAAGVEDFACHDGYSPAHKCSVVGACLVNFGARAAPALARLLPEGGMIAKVAGYCLECIGEDALPALEALLEAGGTVDYHARVEQLARTIRERGTGSSL